MVKLVRLLSISPGQGAFDSADIKFGIDGDRLPIHELVLDGDILSMRGSGWVNMRRELHLDLFAKRRSKESSWLDHQTAIELASSDLVADRSQRYDLGPDPPTTTPNFFDELDGEFAVGKQDRTVTIGVDVVPSYDLNFDVLRLTVLLEHLNDKR